MLSSWLSFPSKRVSRGSVCTVVAWAWAVSIWVYACSSFIIDSIKSLWVVVVARVVKPAAPKLSFIGKSGGGPQVWTIPVAVLLPVTYVVAVVAVWPILAVVSTLLHVPWPRFGWVTFTLLTFVFVFPYVLVLVFVLELEFAFIFVSVFAIAFVLLAMAFPFLTGTCPCTLCSVVVLALYL